MGFFDFLTRGRGDGLETSDTPGDKKLASLGKTASSKRAQTYDREEAIRALIKYGTPGAVAALLRRFSLKVDPSISDQEEKELAFNGILSIGRGQQGKRVSDEGKDAKSISDAPLNNDDIAELRAAVVEKITLYCKNAENLNWALKLLRDLLDDSTYEESLLQMLSEWDTEYVRNVEPKVNLLVALEKVESDAARLAVQTYLEDVNETVRFHAVQTLFAQKASTSTPALVGMMAEEESVRIKNKVAEGFMRLAWTVEEALLPTFTAAFDDLYEFHVSDRGVVGKA